MSDHYMPTITRATDHDVTLAIPGDIGSVRQRLIAAVQKLGYKVIAEQPLSAKRGGVCWDCSVNALDYPTTLTISLKQTNDVAVLATFNYEIKSYVHMTKGDRRTLAREAEAISALATERRAISACRVCGTLIPDESHFCRRCGAPLMFDLPELEVVRLTRGSRGGYHNVLIGVIALLLAASTALPVFVVNGARIFGPLLWVALSLGGYGLFLLLQGIRQLHRTLNPKTLKNASRRLEPALSASVTTALPPASANASITEGTTELLPTTESRVAEPIHRRDESTAEIDTGRLM